MAYSKSFTDHLTNPRNVGELEAPTVKAEETNPVCGDRLQLSLKIVDGTIEAARFLAYGCPPTLVCASALTEIIQGRPVEEAAALTRKQLVDAIGGLPLRKQHAAALAIEALRAALKVAGD